MTNKQSSPSPDLRYLLDAADRATNPLEKAYLVERVLGQIEYYERKSLENQHTYERFKYVTIVFSALIPFIVGYVDNGGVVMGLDFGKLVQFAVGALGATVAMLEGISAFKRYNDHWLGYRATAERLKHEAWLYVTGAGDYPEEPERFPVFVRNMEAIMATENTQWVTIAKEKPASD